ncbi:TPA: hypothetical protein R8B56_004585, partial [Salmonella enterica]|nr:hypothetical protein [Salmonella enterica]EJE6702988.1 hypothetical protein [Salmonella enterica]HEE8431555.1 hypothetical protein [Salmonella enterica]
NIFDDNDYEKACKWYKHIRSNVEGFNVKIEKLREKTALDLLNNEGVDYFHKGYQSFVERFEKVFIKSFLAPYLKGPFYSSIGIYSSIYSSSSILIFVCYLIIN